MAWLQVRHICWRRAQFLETVGSGVGGVLCVGGTAVFCIGLGGGFCVQGVAVKHVVQECGVYGGAAVSCGGVWAGCCEL